MMRQEDDLETGWDLNQPRWAYCLQCTSKPLHDHAKKNGWINSQFTGLYEAIASLTLERLDEQSGLRLTGLELRACYDCDTKKVIAAIVLWKDSVPEPDDDRKEVGKMVDYLKEQLGLDPELEPKWRLINYQYELESGGIDNFVKPESLIKFT